MTKEHKAGQKALRRGRYSQEKARYFITICSFRRNPILRTREIANLIFEYLNDQSQDFEQIASVVMPDHIHLIIRLWNNDLGRSLKRLKGRTAIAINRTLKRNGTVWQKGYFDHKFRGDEDLAPILSYLWRNPKIPGQYFRCNREDWLWFKSMVTEDLDYPEWLWENPMG